MRRGRSCGRTAGLRRAGPAAAEALAPELAALRGRGLLASSSLGDVDGQVSVHPLGARGQVRGFLAVGTTAPLDRTAQSVVAVAVSLLSIAAEQDGTTGAAGRAQVRAATVRLLVAGADPQTLPLEVLGWGWVDDGPLRLVVVGGSAVQRAAAARALEKDSGPDRAVADLGERLLLLLPDDPAAVSAVAQVLVDVPSGGSAASGAAELGRAAREAAQAMAATRGPGLPGTASSPPRGCWRRSTLMSPEGWRRPCSRRSTGARATWSRRCPPGSPATGSGTPRPPTWACTGTRCATGCAASRSCWAGLDDPDLRAELWLALRFHAQDAEVH